jgi:GxxExxY protein
MRQCESWTPLSVANRSTRPALSAVEGLALSAAEGLWPQPAERPGGPEGAAANPAALGVVGRQRRARRQRREPIHMEKRRNGGVYPERRIRRFSADAPSQNLEHLHGAANELLAIPRGGDGNEACLQEDMLADHKVNSLTERIIAAAIEVHRAIGPGLLESPYKTCLQYELSARNIRFVAEQPIPLVYKELAIDAVYRVDLIVEDMLVVELKAVKQLIPLHEAQVLTYMKLTGHSVGLLINFNVSKLVMA